MLILLVGGAAARVAGAQVSTRFVYDAAGQLVQVIEADGTTVTYEYDPVGNLLRRLVSRPTNSSGAIMSLHPQTIAPGTETEITVFGAGLGTAAGVTFATAGITATIIGNPEDNALSLLVRADSTTEPGAHAFTVHRAAQPDLSSGSLAINVLALPTLLGVAPTDILTGRTVEGFTLSGARLDRSPMVLFDRAGVTLTNISASADGRSLTGRLQAAVSTVPGPVGVSVRTSEGTTKKVVLMLTRSLSGLTGSYFGNAFALDGVGLPILPAASPSFIRTDAALQFGASTGFRFRPCFVGSTGCLNGAYTVRWHGHIFLESAGSYTFALSSSDASHVLIAGDPVVSNPGIHGPGTAEGVFVAPASGSYPIVVLFGTSGSTPGIDLLYRAPGATALSPVPAAVLWGDGTIHDPVLTSAAALVSVANPAPVSEPGGVAPVSASSAVVSFFSPAAVPEPGGTALMASASATVSFTNPASVPEPGGTLPVESTSAVISFSNPAPPVSPGGTEPVGAAHSAIGFAAGPVVYEVAPTKLSVSAGGGVLTVTGRNLQNATAVLFENGSGISVSAPSASVDGGTVMVTVTLSAGTPTGFVGVKVSTPAGESEAHAATVLEIVP